MDDLLLYGVPGAGKTTAGIAWLGDRVEEGADLRRAAFVSFTNAAVNVAKGRLGERFGIDPRELVFCRTLHSLCKRALGISHTGWLADNYLKEFCAEFGYDVKAEKKRGRPDEEDLEQRVERSGREAPFLDVWDFGRHRLIFTAAAAWTAFRQYNPFDAAQVPFARFCAFVAHYEAWKAREGLRDMTDLLVEFVRHPVALPVSVSVVDEAQDLSPLMWAVVDRMFATASYRAMLGDDDQALYCFQGASPELLNRRPVREKVKLTHSYRLAAPIADVARRMIRRNVNREPKDLTPAGHDGLAARASSLGDLDLLNGRSWFLQVRNWMLLDDLTLRLEGAGIPYLVRGNRRHSPWSSEKNLAAVRAALRLAAGKPVTLTDMHALVRCGHSSRGAEVGIWAWGAKKRLLERATADPGGRVVWSDLGDLGMTREAVTQLLRGQPFAILTREVSERDLLAYQVARRAGTLEHRSSVELGTMFGFKGDECDCSATITGCTGRAFRALSQADHVEEERRIGYVAVTRAKFESYTLAPRTTRGVYPWEVIGL